MSVPLDYEIQKLPRSLRHEFDWEVEGETYRYVAGAENFEIVSGFGIQGGVRLTKFVKRIVKRWWQRKPRVKWERVWSFSAGHPYQIYILDGNGQVAKFGVRSTITNEAINAGVVPTDLLLNKSLGPIEKQLRKERARLMGFSRKAAANDSA